MPDVRPLRPALLPTTLVAALLCALPARGADTATAAPVPTAPVAAASAQPAPALRQAAMPRRTPAIVLPSVDSLRAAANAEAPRKQPGVAQPAGAGVAEPRMPAVAAAGAGTNPAARRTTALEVPAPPSQVNAAEERPAVAVPAVVLPAADTALAERRRAPSRGFLPPLPLTARPAAPAAAVPAAAAVAEPKPSEASQVTADVTGNATATTTANTTPDASVSASAPAPEAGTVAEPAPSVPVTATAPPAAALPPPDPNSPDPLERLRAKLKQRLAAVKPPDADSPYELQVSTRAVATAAARANHSTAAATRTRSGTAGARAAAAKRPVAKPLGEGEWAYEGDNGPAAWGGLCASGQRQSPIDIRGGLPVALEPIAFHYQAGDFSVLDTGHTVQVNVAPGNHAQLGARRYELKQFHFHRPSEETLDGRRFDMSVHLVHADEQGRRLIVALLVQKGSAQPVLRSVFGNLPLEKRQENKAQGTLNPADLLPGEQAYYTYMGSLTTPPCSEDVQWVVLRHPVAASAEQIELFGRLYTNNIRPLQQAEGRRILQTR